MSLSVEANHTLADDEPGWMWRAAAVLWLVVVLLVGWHQWTFWQSSNINTDVLALLPNNQEAPEVDAATQKLVGGLSRQILLVIGGAEWNEVQQASAWAKRHLQQSTAYLHEQSLADSQSMQSAVAFYAPWRDRLLTKAQQQELEQSSEQQLAQRALMGLYQPAAQMRLLPWNADPLGLWTKWWSERANQSKARPRDGLLWVQSGGMQWSVLTYEVQGSAFGFSDQAPLAQALNDLQHAMQAQWPQLHMLRAGMPLHAEAAAVQANGEMNTIGWGSLVGVLLLVWLAFRSLRPIVLVGVSLLIGTAVALSVTIWCFDQVHVLTLVFGASLVGVAEDYGIHYFAARQGANKVSAFRLMRTLRPSLWMALATSVIAYMALGAASFPGLRQMAVFSVVGLSAALFTVLCWFPWLDKGAVHTTKFSQICGASLNRWPRLPWSRVACSVYALGIFAVLIVIAMKLQVRDDVRQLQNSPVELVQQQVKIGDLLGTPSPTQFYLVSGDSEQAVLEKEELLTDLLLTMVSQQKIAGWNAVSDWVPSIRRQQHDAQLLVQREQAVIQSVGEAVGERMQRADFSLAPLQLSEWMQHPIASTGKNLWVGEVGDRWMSVVMLRGINDRAILPHLAAIADQLDGVRWVDKPQEISQVLQRYRIAMTWLLALGHVLVLVVLWMYFGREAWRAWIPTVIATLLVVAAMAIHGEPWQLFNVLGLVLLLGVGVDYGIFLLEHEDDPTAWLAVLIGAGSTWLAFGLLALSSTPALQSFGITLMVGLPAVLCLAPCFRAHSIQTTKFDKAQQ